MFFYVYTPARGCCETDHERYGLSKHQCGSFQPLYGMCLPKWKWSLLARQQHSMTHDSNCARLVPGT